MVKYIPFILLISFQGLAQQFPVQCHFSLSQPHASYLPDMSGDMEIVLELTDLSEPSLDVMLQVEVWGNNFTITTDISRIMVPITLLPSTPYGLSTAEIEYYLETERNIFTGINLSEYEDLRRFPEGSYDICIKILAFDQPDHDQVSNEVCVTDWFLLSDPPLLFLPACNSDICYGTPSDLQFSWEAMHLNSPNITTPAEYLLEIWELFPPDADPENYALSQFPVFSIITTSLFYSYTLSDPVLYAGRSYCWRVTVRDVDGAALFNNNGRSEVCTFKLTESWDIPFEFNLLAFPQSHRRVLLQWNEYQVMNEYLLQVRREGMQNWFEFSPNSGSFTLNGLEAGTPYEARVKGLYNEGETAWSDITLFSTQQLPVYTCNTTGMNISVPTGQPAQNLINGSYLRCGDFDVKILSSDPGVTQGFFSGTGKVGALPGLNLNVSFRNIFVNAGLEMEAGEIQALTQGISAWTGQWSYQSSAFFNGIIDTLFVQNGLVYIISENGDTTFMQEDFSGGLLITDQNGDQWVVNPDGTVTPVGGNILLPVTSAPLSALELEILSRAFLIIKTEVTDHLLDSTRMLIVEKKQVLQNGIHQQREPYNDAGMEGDVAFFGISAEQNPSPDALGTLNKQYKQAEQQLNCLLVLHYLSRNMLEVPQLNYFGNYLSIQGRSYPDWLRLKQAEGLSNDQLPRLLADEGIRELVRKVVELKTKR